MELSSQQTLDGLMAKYAMTCKTEGLFKFLIKYNFARNSRDNDEVRKEERFEEVSEAWEVGS